MVTVKDFAHDLLPCPKCGAEAKRVEWEFDYYDKRWHKDRHVHRAAIECSNGGKCYHVEGHSFEDDYESWRGNYALPNTDYELQWKWLDCLWNKRVIEYPIRKAQKEATERRRCSCGRLARKGESFCPRCGKPTPEEAFK